MNLRDFVLNWILNRIFFGPIQWKMNFQNVSPMATCVRFHCRFTNYRGRQSTVDRASFIHIQVGSLLVCTFQRNYSCSFEEFWLGVTVLSNHISLVFSAVQGSSIGDIVTHSVCWWVSQVLISSSLEQTETNSIKDTAEYYCFYKVRQLWIMNRQGHQNQTETRHWERLSDLVT